MTDQRRRRRTHEALGTFQAGPALAAFAARVSGAAIGFSYRPVDARWFRLDADGTPRGPNGEPVDLTGVSELRAFTDAYELRWHHSSAGNGTAILVSDAEAAPAATGPWLHSEQPYERLLWGTASEPPVDGWLSLHTARIGTLLVPIDGPVPLPGRAWLRAVEYEAEDAHGNVAVVDERLVGLVVREREVDSTDDGEGLAR